MFTLADSTKHSIELEKAPVNVLLDLLLIPTKAPLSYIFNLDSYRNTFLLTYTAFISRAGLFSYLETQLFKSESRYVLVCENRKEILKLMGASIQDTIIDIIETWMRCFSEDWRGEKMKGKLDNLCDKISSSNIEKKQQYLADLDYKKIVTSKILLKSDAPAVIFPTVADESQWTLLDLDKKEFANQITLMCENLVLATRTREFTRKRCHLKNLCRDSKIRELLQLISHIQGLIPAEIYSRPKASERVKILEYFCQVMVHLEEHGNLPMISVIASTLYTPPISKLREWDVSLSFIFLFLLFLLLLYSKFIRMLVKV